MPLREADIRMLLFNVRRRSILSVHGMRFKNKIFITAAISCAALLFCACAGKGTADEGEAAVSQSDIVTEETQVTTAVSTVLKPKSKQDFINNSDIPAVKAAVAAKEESMADRPDHITIKGVDIPSDTKSLTLNNKGLTNEDIADLKYLIDLEELQIYENNITDLSVLQGLTNLTTLSLFKNKVSDLTPLAGLVNLQTLYLRSNEITDISPLAGLTKITNLDLSDNDIEDISALSGMTGMMLLKLNDNNIEDISALGNMASMDRVHIQNNRIKDITPLWRMTQLTELYAENNEITDISVLGEMKKLGWLKLSDNPVEDLSPICELPVLKKLWISGIPADREALEEYLPDCIITY